MPQIGQEPGPTCRISGCIGQVKIVPAGIGAAGSRAAGPRYFPGSAANFVRQPAEQKIIGVAAMDVAVRRRVRIDRHAADRIDGAMSDRRMPVPAVARWMFVLVRSVRHGSASGLKSIP